MGSSPEGEGLTVLSCAFIKATCTKILTLISSQPLIVRGCLSTNFICIAACM